MENEKLNRVYTSLGTRRRYEVWFLKLALADGSGAWWFRYLMTNPGNQRGGNVGGCPGLATSPIQVWATWFPAGGTPESYIEGFTLADLSLSRPGTPLHFEHGLNRITHDSCRGRVTANGRTVEWDLRYRSSAGFVMSNVGWIGFSRTPHTDAVFEGEILVDGKQVTGPLVAGQPLGYGLQGHNCGFRHRHLWTWAHGLHLNESGELTSFEALEYEIAPWLYFRRGLLWHEGRLYRLKGFRTAARDRASMAWEFSCQERQSGVSVAAIFNGGGSSLHRLPYTRTDCSGTFEVSNNSLASGNLRLAYPDRPGVELSFNAGAVLEMVGG